MIKVQENLTEPLHHKKNIITIYHFDKNPSNFNIQNNQNYFITSEFIPVLKALDVQKLSPLPFQQGALLNLSGKRNDNSGRDSLNMRHLHTQQR
jgi:hypothetical protein